MFRSELFTLAMKKEIMKKLVRTLRKFWAQPPWQSRDKEGEFQLLQLELYHSLLTYFGISVRQFEALLQMHRLICEDSGAAT